MASRCRQRLRGALLSLGDVVGAGAEGGEARAEVNLVEEAGDSVAVGDDDAGEAAAVVGGGGGAVAEGEADG